MEQDHAFADVKRRSLRWMNGWIAQDRAAIEPFMADDYALIVSTVPELSFERENWLQTAVSSYVCTRFAYENIQFRRVADDMIVMSSIADFDAKMAGIDRSGRYFVTDLWRREHSNWKVCLRYSSRPGEIDDSVRAIIASH